MRSIITYLYWLGLDSFSAFFGLIWYAAVLIASIFLLPRRKLIYTTTAGWIIFQGWYLWDRNQHFGFEFENYLVNLLDSLPLSFLITIIAFYISTLWNKKRKQKKISKKTDLIPVAIIVGIWAIVSGIVMGMNYKSCGNAIYSWMCSPFVERYGTAEQKARAAIHGIDAKTFTISKSKKISFWTETYEVTEENDNSISFGPSQNIEGGSVREYIMHVRPQQNAEAVIKKVNSGDLVIYSPRILTINSLTVVRYASSGLCTYPALMVIGKYYNYEFTTTCSTNINKTFSDLERVVQTVNLLP